MTSSASHCLLHSARAGAERQRVQAHLRRAEALLEAGSSSVYHPLRRLVRALLRSELSHYRARGRFPLNPDFSAPTPYFVDALGTRCAVAHLLEVSGEGPLVRRIARAGNNLRVRELAAEPRLVAWLAAAGLTLEEAAAIQPAYQECSADPADCVCQGSNALAVLEGPLVQVGQPGSTRMRVDRIDGAGGYVREGDELAIALLNPAQARLGATVLVPASPEAYNDAAQPPTLWGAVLAEDGTYSCQSHLGPLLPLSADQYKQALLAPSCQAYLMALSPAWEPSGCERTTSCGCTLYESRSAERAPTTIGILLALLSVFALRRRAAQRRLARAVVGPP